MRRALFAVALVLLLEGGTLLALGLFRGGDGEAPALSVYTEQPCVDCPVSLESVEVQDRQGSTLFVIRGGWPASVGEIPGDVRLVANDLDLVLRPNDEAGAFEVVSGPDPGSVAAGLQGDPLLINLADGTVTPPVQFVVGLADEDRFTVRLPADGALVWDGSGAPRQLPNAEPVEEPPAEEPPAEEEAVAETPEAFAQALGAAFRAGDAGFLFDRLNPAVLDVYGAGRCRRYVRGQQDPTREFDVRAVSDLQPYDYAPDGASIAIPEVYTLDVRITIAGEISRQEVHFAPLDGGLTWFTDCGEPLP